MLITRLKLKNWRNFVQVDVPMRDRVYLIGANASGKSNLLDALRFLRDIAKPDGGGFQKAVKDRGGVPKIRCLAARKDPKVLIEIELSETVDAPPKWLYRLEFRSEGKGLQRALVNSEYIANLHTGWKHVRPSAEETKDPAQLTQTAIEQIALNQRFREVAEFLTTITYLHLVPQLLKYGEQMGGYRLESDPFGQGFLERVGATPARTRDARLRKIEVALRACVPKMRDLRYEQDEKGKPHLQALYEHWRPDAGVQREEQFSDGTLRLLGIMWSLLDGDTLLLLEEPELSLNEEVVRRIPSLIWRMQRDAKHRRQILISTHSEALLSDRGIDPREVLRLEPSENGTQVLSASAQERDLVASGYSVGQVMLPKVKPSNIDQLSLFGS